MDEWHASGRAILVDGARGRVKNQCLQAVRDSAGAVQRLGRDFGLSPQAREELSIRSPIPPDKTGDDAHDRARRLVGI